MNKKSKILLITLGSIFGVLLLAALIVPFPIVNSAYDSNFAKHFTTYEGFALNLDDFDGLNREKYTFPSNKGQILTGYKYFHDDTDVKGLVVFAHGFGGGGHNGYMNLINYFAEKNYLVFAYDATANDESEGDVVGGLPQGIVDLDYTLRFVKSEKDFSNLPIFLWGHSWGGYSVGSVTKLHSDVKGVMVVSGFNSSADMFESEGRNIAGGAIKFIMPFYNIIDRKKYGDYASMSIVDSLSESKVPAMFLHSKDDSTIPFEDSFEIYYEAFGKDSNYLFETCENRGHNYVVNSDIAREYRNQYEVEYSEYRKNQENMTYEMKVAYDKANFDKKTANHLDEDLMAKMIKFCDENR